MRGLKQLLFKTVAVESLHKSFNCYKPIYFQAIKVRITK